MLQKHKLSKGIKGPENSLPGEEAVPILPQQTYPLLHHQLGWSCGHTMRAIGSMTWPDKPIHQMIRQADARKQQRFCIPGHSHLYLHGLFLKQIRYCELLSSHNYAGKLSVGYLPTAWWHKGTRWSSVKSSNRHHCTKWLPLARAQEAGDSSRERWSDSLNFSVPILTQTLAISSLFLLFSTGLSDQLSLSLPLPWSLLPAHTSYSALSAPKKHRHHL